MIHKTAYVMGLLLASTVAGISLSLFGQERWMKLVFWYSSQLLPVIYIGLAWWGSCRKDAQADVVFDHEQAPATPKALSHDV